MPKGKPPFTFLFEGTVRPIVSEEKDKYLALASIDTLRSFIPNIDMDENADLLPVAFNACVVNRANKNDDGITTQQALAIADHFKNKPINLEHDRKKVVGVIVHAGFSEFGSDKPLTREEVKDYTKPFNMTLGAVVWRVVNDDLADVIEESNDPTSPYYLKISASWELGFYNYQIAVCGPEEKNFENASYVSDDKEVADLKANLRAYGGNGRDKDGNRLYRVPKGKVLALGIGLTDAPAADVEGVAVPEELAKKTVKALDEAKKSAQALDKAFKEGVVAAIDNFSKETLEKAQETTKTAGEQITESLKKIDESLEVTTKDLVEAINRVGNTALDSTATMQELISQTEKTVVNKDSLHMKITDVKDITDESLKTMKASEVTDFIAEQLKVAAEEYKAQSALSQQTLEEAKKSQDTLAAEHAKNKELLAEFEKKIKKLEEDAVAREVQEAFNARMEALNDKYELDEELSKVIAAQIRGLTDEQYEAQEKTLNVLLKGKEKQPATATASTTPAAPANPETVVSAAVDNGKPSTPTVPATPTVQPPSLKEKFSAAFSEEGWDIKLKRK